jgi:hypothetical protein
MTESSGGRKIGEFVLFTALGAGITAIVMHLVNTWLTRQKEAAVAKHILAEQGGEVEHEVQYEENPESEGFSISDRVDYLEQQLLNLRHYVGAPYEEE